MTLEIRIKGNESVLEKNDTFEINCKAVVKPSASREKRLTFLTFGFLFCHDLQFSFSSKTFDKESFFTAKKIG